MGGIGVKLNEISSLDQPKMRKDSWRSTYIGQSCPGWGKNKHREEVLQRKKKRWREAG